MDKGVLSAAKVIELERNLYETEKELFSVSDRLKSRELKLGELVKTM